MRVVKARSRSYPRDWR